MKDFKPFFILFCTSLVFAIIDYFGLKLFGCNTSNFFYTISELFLYFTAASLVVLIVLVWLKKKQPEQIGYVFLFVSSLKMVAAYALMYPILQNTEDGIVLEKINFFIVFLLFLAIDVFLTSILLKDVGKNN